MNKKVIIILVLALTALPVFSSNFGLVFNINYNIGSSDFFEKNETIYQSGGYNFLESKKNKLGMGFNVGIIDDPVKDEEEAASQTMRDKVWDWYQKVFRTRAEPDAAIIIVMTRWHQDDLVGHLLKQLRLKQVLSHQYLHQTDMNLYKMH